jgi:uncharacterized protein (TIGR03067 family)
VTQPLCLLLSAGLLVGAYAPAPDPERTRSGPADLKRMQGNWTVVRMEYGGKARPAAETAQFRAVIKGNVITAIRDGRPDGGDVTFTLDAKKKPRQITLKPRLDGMNKEIPGIYKLDKDTLTICFSRGGEVARPRTFSTKENMGHALIVFKRAKP